MLEMENSLHQIKNTLGSITNGLDQAEEIISGMEDKIEEIVHSQP
jgi:archaellum component FlaC